MDKKRIIKMLIEFAILLVATFFVFYVIVKDDLLGILKMLKNLNILKIIIIVAISIVNVVSQGYILKLCASEFNENYTTMDGTNCYLVGNLMSGITPLKVGYQFGMLYMFNKKNLKLQDSLVVSHLECTLSQVATTFYSILLAIFLLFNPLIITIDNNKYNMNFVVFLIIAYNVITLIVLFLLINWKGFGTFVVKLSYKITAKFFKKKDPEKVKKNTQLYTERICNSAQLMYKDKWQSCKIILIYCLRYFLIYSLPYLIYLFLSNDGFALSTFITSLMYTVMISYTSSFLPIPGGTGGVELIYFVVFASIIPTERMIRTSVLVWRFFSYYVYLIAGIIALAYTKVKDNNISNKRYALLHYQENLDKRPK